MSSVSRIAGLMACTTLATPARAFADLNFDATQVAPDQGSGDPLPSGWYIVAIDESEKKPTNEGEGWGLNLRFDVLEGQHKGRKLFTFLNMKHPNQQTVEIAQKQLSAICHAVNVLKPQKSEELHAKPLKVKVGQKPASGGYDAGNKITAYKNINEQVDLAGGDSGGSVFGAGAAAASGLTPPPASDAPAQPWAQGATAAMGATPAPDTNPQPWATGAAATDTPPPPAPAAETPPPPAPVAHDPMKAAEADGWKQHPSSPPHMYKGQEVKTHADVAALYPAPAVPDVPPAPSVPAAPAADTATAAAGSTATASSDPAAAQGANPPWANK